MPDSVTVQLIMAIGIPNVFLYVFIDKWMHNRADAVATGVVRGVAVPTDHRQLLLIMSWGTAFAVGIGAQSVFSIGYWLLSKDASTDTARKFAELYTFFSIIGVVNWLAQAPVWFIHLRSVLKRAERT